MAASGLSRPRPAGDPATSRLGESPEVVLLVGFVAVLLAGVILVVTLRARGRSPARSGEGTPPAAVTADIAPWVLEGRQLFAQWQERIERLDEMKSRLGGMAEEIERLRAEVGHVEEMRAQISRLGEESEQGRVERDHLLGLLSRIASLAREAAGNPST